MLTSGYALHVIFYQTMSLHRGNEECWQKIGRIWQVYSA